MIKKNPFNFILIEQGNTIFAPAFEAQSICSDFMVVVAQLVRAPVCGTGGRGFEPHLPPRKVRLFQSDFFY